MSTWNYRIIHTTYILNDKTYDEYGIHEVYYDSDGNIDGYTKRSVPVSGNSVDEIEAILDRMQRALQKPVIEVKTGQPPED